MHSLNHPTLSGNDSGVAAFTVTLVKGQHESPRYNVVRTFGDQTSNGFMLEGSPERFVLDSAQLGQQLGTFLREGACICRAEPSAAWLSDALDVIRAIDDPVLLEEVTIVLGADIAVTA